MQAGRETAEAALLEGGTKLRLLPLGAHTYPQTSSGSRAPTKTVLRSGLIPSTPKPGTRCPSPDARSRKQSRSAPRCSPARLRTRGGGVRLQETARSQLGAPTSSTRPQTQPAHQADPGGHPSKHCLGPNLRSIYTYGADRSGDKEKNSRDHGDPD